MSDINFSFPISMIKKEQRIVVGIATADNVDKANDVVDPDASIEAFKNWQGNIREMHAPIAVGKAISHRPVTVKGPDGREYRAIEVEAYISKGAQSTWEKVLDGTLRAFSIGGKIVKKEVMQGKMHNGRPINYIKQYQLGELSLVDNPANPMAVIDVVKFDNNHEHLDYILKIDCSDINLRIPASVQRVAQAGLNQRKEYGRGGTSVGLGSARRLAQGGVASPEFVRKVARYFPRHEVDLRANGANPGEKGYPSNGRIAWNLWGGTPGWAWARSKVRQLDNCTRKSFDGVSCSCSLSDGASCWEEFIEKQNEVTTQSMASGLKKPQQGYKKTKKKKLKKSDIEAVIEDTSDIFEAFDKPEIEEAVIDLLQNGGFDEFMDEMEKGCGEDICNCGCDVNKAAPTKREEGEDFPAAAFAYVPDPSMPSTWKLRLWDSIAEKETPAQVGRAVAALGAEFRGNKVSIPSKDLTAVKSRVLAAWKKVNKDKKEEDIPSVLKFETNLTESIITLQNHVEYDKVKPMDNSLTDNKLTLAKKFLNWFMPENDLDLEKSDENNNSASTQVEVSVEQVEDTMDIDVLKEALGSVIDDKLTAFATSFKEEVEADVAAKIDEMSKSFETQKAELAEKLENTEKALEEQTAKVDQFASAGAVKKSVDPEDDEDGEELVKSAPQKSFWGNMYLPQGLINSLGYKS